jgi:hypothetical protein
LRWLEHRQKKVESMARKIADGVRKKVAENLATGIPPPISAEEWAALAAGVRVGDSLRYTIEFPTGSFLGGAARVIVALASHSGADGVKVFFSKVVNYFVRCT